MRNTPSYITFAERAIKKGVIDAGYGASTSETNKVRRDMETIIFEAPSMSKRIGCFGTFLTDPNAASIVKDAAKKKSPKDLRSEKVKTLKHRKFLDSGSATHGLAKVC